MARRKDNHTEDLKQLILQAAERIIFTKGLKSLTARALANAVGYTPGTIYNFYRDMDALILDVNYRTLGRLHANCVERMKDLPPDFSKVRALAHAYFDFAHKNTRAWTTIFATPRKRDGKTRIPKRYRERLLEVFQLIEHTLHDCLDVPPHKAPETARLLWACLHGITILTLDGRLKLIGVQKPHSMIDDLLDKHLHEKS